jgi:hypothetical protein
MVQINQIGVLVISGIFFLISMLLVVAMAFYEPKETL